ncbi:MAG: hypothetical protein NC218_08100 [Acetobacter sp.]|nr:hypothetical protein [Acetobacter sp.]
MAHDIELLEEMQRLQVLVRTNNLLLSRFILELSRVQQQLDLPKRKIFFKFEILNEEYDGLVAEFGKDTVDKALYKLDRLLLTNKQHCPNNITKYVRNRIKGNLKRNE